MTNDRWRLTATGRSRGAAKAALLGAVLLVATAACAPKRLTLPVGPGTPAADYGPAFDRASAACSGVRSLKATIRLSGRAGGQRMRGTLLTGMDAPDAVRLEGVAPFGAPVFILAARNESATLLLPRDDRVLTGVSPADILEALTGVRIDPAALRAIVSGCVAAETRPAGGRLFPNGWMSVDIGSGATVYLRPEQGRWRIVAGITPRLEVQYAQFEGDWPRQVHVFSRADQPAAIPVDLTLALSDVSINVVLPAAAFTVDVPPRAAPMTLAELREVGPLGEKK